MSKDIVIQNEYSKTVHLSGVTRLRTDLEDGGDCYWVPEDEAVSLGTKSITENGTYTAASDDVSGYSSVSVNVQANVEPKIVRENGSYNASDDNVDGYSELVVNVPNSYGVNDEGMVVSDGALVGQTALGIIANGTYDTTLNNEVIVDVGNTFGAEDEGKVIMSGALVEQTSRTISVNGTYDTTTNDSVTVETSSNLTTKTINTNGTYAAANDSVDGYSEVTVSVPNTYVAADEGKVVSSGALSAQTSRTISANGTYDTTTNDSVIVETSSNLTTKTINSNGTYAAANDSVDGYSEVTVSVPNTFGAGDEGKVVFSGALTVQTSLSITSNGTYSTTTNDSVIVSVPNSYLWEDNGKVLIDGSLVSQTSRSINALGTYDTTSNNSVTIEGLGNFGSKTIFANGSYFAADDGYDGFDLVDIRVGTNLGQITISTNGYYRAEWDNLDGYNEVNVNLDLVYKEINENGTYYSSDEDAQGYYCVDVNVSDIGRSMIERNVENVSLSELYEVGEYAFAGCSNLRTVFLPDCESIGSYAFDGCWNLTSIYLLTSASGPLLIDYDIFENCSIPDIYVDPEYAQEYLSQNYWSKYASRIIPYPYDSE